MDKPLTDNPKTIILAGATGNLGSRIARELLKRGAVVRALVRYGNSGGAEWLREHGAEVVEVDYDNPEQLATACSGGACVVSALSGVRDVIVDVQYRLLEAALNAHVPRFIPSDYCIDYTKLPRDGNRNLELRREFAKFLDIAPIKATSILCGMFAELLTGEARIINFRKRKVTYWGRVDQEMDFTTMDNAAEFTAAAALDDDTPRYLRIAGDVDSTLGLCHAATEATGQSFKTKRLGGLRRFRLLIRIVKFLFPGKRTTFPAWQGMRYMYDMYTGWPKLEPLDNERYPGIEWTEVAEVLRKR